MGVDEALAHLLQLQRRTFAVFVERRAERDPGRPTRIQSHVLNIIKDQGQISVSDVARALNVTVPTASQLLNTMGSRGWVSIDISSTDRRRHDVRMTAEGLAMLGERYQKRLGHARTVLTQLSSEERRTLVDLADRVVTLWQDVRHEEAPTEGSSHDGGSQDRNKNPD